MEGPLGESVGAFVTFDITVCWYLLDGGTGAAALKTVVEVVYLGPKRICDEVRKVLW